MKGKTMKQDSLQKLNTNIEQLLQQDEKPITFTEASEYLGVSKSHLYKLTSKNQIVHFKPAGKKIYFKKSDLNSYLFRNRKASHVEIEQIALDRVYQE
jgi:excisionase family DNA binding protein